MRGISIGLIFIMTTAACVPGEVSGPDGEPTTTVPVESSTTSEPVVTTTTVPPQDCGPSVRDPGSVDVADPVAVAVAISRSTFDCADEVTLAPVGDRTATAAAGRRAVEVGGPVLLVEGALRGDVASEIRRLDPIRVGIIGLPDVPRDLLAAYELVELGPLEGTDPLPVRVDEPSRVWIVDDEVSEALWPVVWAAATQAGGSAVRSDGDLRGMRPVDLEAVEAGGDAPVILVSSTDDAPWQLEVIRTGRQLPGGGYLLFPGRRLVALYGNPSTPALGVLGEQGPEEGVALIDELAGSYDDDGVPVTPAFEIIATIASSLAGRDGDYSAEMGVADLEPWVDAAAELGAYVVLDLQPGRSDFLTQARAYETLLRRPHVGLALDPEWRLGPGQFHLRQTGSVDASEINAVAEWLAGIVREEALPQKLLLLHQFRFSMISNRDDVITPPELAVVVQMDGQGPLATKYETWSALTAGTADAGWRWGWKNFFDEDSPMATPEQVLELEPVPVYVSFQ